MDERLSRAFASAKQYFKVLVSFILVLIIFYTLFVLLGGWFLMMFSVIFAIIALYTIFIYQVPHFVVVIDEHHATGTDNFEVYNVPVERFARMERNGDGSPLNSKDGMVYFAEHIDTKNNKIKLTWRHWSTFDFDIKHTLFTELRDEFEKLLVDHEKLLLAQRVRHLQGVSDTMREHYAVLDKVLFDSPLPEKNELEVKEKVEEKQEEIEHDEEKQEQIKEKTEQGLTP